MVLTLRSSFGEVERERALVGTEVIDIEHQFLGQVLGITPHDPTHTWVYKPVLVAGGVDRDNSGQTEIPHKI